MTNTKAPVTSESIGLPRGYRIYRDGTITSVKSGTERHLSQYTMTIGYKAVCIKCEGKSIPHYVHRLLALAYIPNPDNKPQVNHKDGDKLNNSLDNLEWCTGSENISHAYRIGLISQTEKKKRSSRKNAHKMILARRRFTDSQIDEIKTRRSCGETYRTIAESFGCDHTTILDICKNNSYQKNTVELDELANRLR